MGAVRSVAISRSHDPISRVPFAMLATNDSTALERSEFNKDIAAFCKCVGAYGGGDLVPVQFSVLAADHVADLFTDEFAGDVSHRQTLADVSRSMGRIPGGCHANDRKSAIASSISGPTDVRVSFRTIVYVYETTAIAEENWGSVDVDTWLP